MSVLYSPNTLPYSDGELRKNPEMDSIHHLNSGLLRYRSAPSSLLASLVQNSHGSVNEEASRTTFHHQQQQQHHHHHHHHHHHQASSSSETEAMLARLVSSTNNGWIKQEEAGNSVSEGQGGYKYNSSYGSQIIYQQSQQVQGLPNGSLGSSGNAFEGRFNSSESKMGSNNLIRQKGSPAGLFNNSPIENGFAGWEDVGSYRACDVSNGQASCSTQLPQIAENGNETLEESATCPAETRDLRNDNNGSNMECYVPSFTGDFWDGSTFSDPKTATDNDEIMFSSPDAFETQNAEFGYQNVALTHHLSLPSSSSKTRNIEKFLQLQGSAIPCKIRAKRGFATHPRSIAERVRRTRISERMKKLQELFPKSDKQTSTADMLDLAVDYIKDLQKQVKMLTEVKTKCKCPSTQKHSSTPYT